MPAGQRRVLSILLNTGLFGIMARLGLMEGRLPSSPVRTWPMCRSRSSQI
jgi:hypothetical protein